MTSDTYMQKRLEFSRFAWAQVNREYRSHQAAYVTCQREITDLEGDIKAVTEMGELSDNDRKQLGRFQTQHTILLGKLRRLGHVLKEEDVKHRSGLTSFGEQYDRILTLPRAFSLFVSGGWVVLETQTLYGKNEPGDWRIIGEFSLEFNPEAKRDLCQCLRWKNKRGAVCVKNTRAQKCAYIEVMTPTGVSMLGQRNCLGNARDLVEEAIRADDYVTLFASMMRFAECSGGHYGNLIQYWPEVSLEEVPMWYRQQFGD